MAWRDDRDTAIGGRHHRFPPTRRSAIAAAASEDPGERTRALDAIVAAYWKPVYKYVRIKWRRSNEDAKDLTQGFFARALEKEFFRAYDPAKASFRTYLRTCLDGYLSNERKAAQRLKRGGGVALQPLDFDEAEAELGRVEAPDALAPDAFFHQEWVRSFFSKAVDELQAECRAAGKAIHFQIFERYDLDERADGTKPSYQELAERFALPVTTVTNHLAAARRLFRRIVLARLREISGNDEEFAREARALLGVEP